MSYALPAHASPKIPPLPRTLSGTPSELDLHEVHHHDHIDNEDGRPTTSSSFTDSHIHDLRTSHRTLMGYSIGNGTHSPHQPPPPSLISPAFTPPGTPGTMTPAHERPARSILVDSTLSTTPAPRLLESLPHVNCIVRARIPTTITGQEMFLHLYNNDIDNKEHLAIVFGPHIRSRSLDAPRLGETEMDRMIRGAYTGRLYPGRTSSRVVDGVQSQASPVHKMMVRDRMNVSNAHLGIGNGSTRGTEDDGQSSNSRGRDYTASNEQGDLQDYSQDTYDSQDNTTNDDPFATTPPLVRIHSECYTGETVWSARCDCGEQLEEAARLMSMPLPSDPHNRHSPKIPNPGGVIIYLRQEGRGIGLSEKLKAYNLQDLGSDTVDANLLLRHPADARSYGLATAMLEDLNLGGERGIRLLTNNPEKVRAVEGPNREVIVKERVAMVPISWKTGGKEGVRGIDLEKYLRTKSERMSHMSLSRDEV